MYSHFLLNFFFQLRSEDEKKSKITLRSYDPWYLVHMICKYNKRFSVRYQINELLAFLAETSSRIYIIVSICSLFKITVWVPLDWIIRYLYELVCNFPVVLNSSFALTALLISWLTYCITCWSKSCWFECSADQPNSTSEILEATLKYVEKLRSDLKQMDEVKLRVEQLEKLQRRLLIQKQVMGTTISFKLLISFCDECMAFTITVFRADVRL